LLTAGSRARSWLNHLNPAVRKGPWDIEEEETLIHGHRCVDLPARRLRTVAE